VEQVAARSKQVADTEENKIGALVKKGWADD
jgi:hypothetical protein